MVLQHILANFRQPGSYSLALQWLYSLFVAYSQADISAQHEAAASAHVNAPQVSPSQLTVLSKKVIVSLGGDAVGLACSKLSCLWNEEQASLRSERVLLMQLRAALASALDDDDMAASLAGRSDQLQPSLSSPADQQSHVQPSAASAAATIEADQLSETIEPSPQQQPKQVAETQGATARIGDNKIVPVNFEQDNSSAGLQVEVSATSAAIKVPQITDTVQDRSIAEPNFSGRDHAADLAGTLYEIVLLAILEGLRSVS